MLAPPVTALGLRLSDEEVRIAVGVKIGTTLYEPHLCHHCREKVDTRGLHGLLCRRGSGKHQRHSMLNDVVWRALGRAKIPAHKEPLGLSRRWKAARRCHADPFDTRTMSCMGCDRVRH